MTVAKKKTAPRIKNYRSQAEMSSIFEAIRQSLATHKAKRIMFEYDDDGMATCITFAVEVNGEHLVFKLPNRFENVEKAVAESYKSAGKSIVGETLKGQAYRTSWANIRDWILAQMALIDSYMVRTEEVFFPYLLDQGGKTVFETFEQRQLLPGNTSEGYYRIEETKGGR